MNLDGVKMFICKKYHTSMLASAADATCAKRFEGSLNENSTIHDFDKCRTCLRGAAMYELGKHQKLEVGRVKGEVIEINTAKGETIMAKEWHKSCDEHGPYTATGPRGGCPKCKTPKKSGGSEIALRTPNSELRTPNSELVTAVSISIDLARFPKLHSRLISVGLNTMLAELETKA